MKLKGWELVGWNYNGDGCNRNISLSEEQAWAVFNALGIEMKDVPGEPDKFEISMLSDYALEHNRTCGKSTSLYNGKPLKTSEELSKSNTKK